MSSEHTLPWCRTCANQSFSMQQGVICGLTKEKADFIGSCPSFVEDPQAKADYERDVAAREATAAEHDSMGLSKLGIKDGSSAGVFLIVGGVGTILFTVLYLNVISLWSFVIIAAGIVALVRGKKRNKAENAKKKALADTLDGDNL